MRAFIFSLLLTVGLSANQLTLSDLTPGAAFSMNGGESMSATIISDDINPANLETYGMAVFVTDEYEYRNGFVSYLWSRYDYANGYVVPGAANSLYLPIEWDVCGIGIYMAALSGGRLTFSNDSIHWTIYEGIGMDTLMLNGRSYTWTPDTYLLSYSDATYGSMMLYVSTDGTVPESAATIALMAIALAVLMFMGWGKRFILS